MVSRSSFRIGPILLRCAALGVQLCASNSVNADALVAGDGFEITDIDVVSELDYMPAQIRKATLADSTLLRSLLDDIYRRAVLAEQARRSGVLAQDRYAYRLRRAELEELVSIAIDEQMRLAVERVPSLEQRAEEQYRANISHYQVPERVWVRHILLKASTEGARNKALETLGDIRRRLDAGEEFPELARQFSEDRGSAKRGGDLGFVAPGKLVPEFERAAFALTEPGELSPIVQTKFGFHLIQLVERQEARQKPFEEVEESIISKLKGEFVRNEVDAWRRELVDPTKAKVNSKAIDAFVERMTRPEAVSENELAD